MNELFNAWMNESFSCLREAVINKRQKFNVFRHVQFEQHHMVVQVRSNDKNCWMGRFCPRVEKNMQPENALLTTTTTPRCTWTSIDWPNLPIIVLLHCTGITKPKVCTYTYLCGVQGLGSKHHFSVDKFSKFGFRTIKGSIHPGYFIRVVPN